MVPKGGKHEHDRFSSSTQTQLLMAVSHSLVGSKDKELKLLAAALERLWYANKGLFAHFPLLVVDKNLAVSHAALVAELEQLIKRSLPCGYDDIKGVPAAAGAYWMDLANDQVRAVTQWLDTWLGLLPTLVSTTVF
jgi:hypothetical protein